MNLDDLVKSQKTVFSVIPAKPVLDSIQEPESRHLKQLKEIWTPAFAGVTTFYETTHLAFGKNDCLSFKLMRRDENTRGMLSIWRGTETGGVLKLIP